ncbi:MAG: hypothetical protein H6Q11_1224, partial [Acidobacteria bacterium]|nr:hypothetical protein [Acidobacteriota bacterium]
MTHTLPATDQAVAEEAADAAPVIDQQLLADTIDYIRPALQA